METGSKISGAGFPVYKGWGAKLERSLISFMLDMHSAKHGYTEVWPPAIVNRASMKGTGQIPKMESDMYALVADEGEEKGSHFLIPTAEVPITNFHRDDILDEKELPIKYAGYSPCFRKEAGSYGKDTRGLSRVHQFDKVELVKFVKPETSSEELERLVQDAENILQALELPYRVLLLGSGDMSFAAAKCYDSKCGPRDPKWYLGFQLQCFCGFSGQENEYSLQGFKTKDGICPYVKRFRRRTGANRSLYSENFQTEGGTVDFPKALKPSLGL